MKKLSKPEQKFTVDMTYGMLAFESSLLTTISDKLFMADVGLLGAMGDLDAKTEI